MLQSCFVFHFTYHAAQLLMTHVIQEHIRMHAMYDIATNLQRKMTIEKNSALFTDLNCRNAQNYRSSHIIKSQCFVGHNTAVQLSSDHIILRYSTVQYSTVQMHIILHHTIVQCIALCCIVAHSTTAQQCCTLYDITSLCVTMCRIAL